MKGTWAKNADMHPLVNVYGRKYRGSDGSRGEFYGWLNLPPPDLEWFFPDEIQPSRVPMVAKQEVA